MKGMLAHIAVADAYGAAFEFTDTPNIKNDLSGFGRHASGTLEKASYTDDLMRAMANVHVMLEENPYNPRCYARAYLDAYDQDQRSGWSKRFEGMLKKHVHRGATDFMRDLRRLPTNGCVMGVSVLGHLETAADVKLAATMQTVATHSAAAVPYAQVVALAAHHLLHGGTSVTALDFVLHEVEWEDDAQQNRFVRLTEEPPVPEMPAHTIAAGAMWAIANHDNLSDMLMWACSRGRDTDSLAAVSVALGWAARDIRSNLPRHLHDTVDTAAGRRHLAQMDLCLADMLKH